MANVDTMRVLVQLIGKLLTTANVLPFLMEEQQILSRFRLPNLLVVAVELLVDTELVILVNAAVNGDIVDPHKTIVEQDVKQDLALLVQKTRFQFQSGILYLFLDLSQFGVLYLILFQLNNQKEAQMEVVDVLLPIPNKTLLLIGMLIVDRHKEEKISVSSELLHVFVFLDNVKKIPIKMEEVDYPEVQLLEL